MLATPIPRYTYSRETSLAPLICRSCGGVERVPTDRLRAPSACHACGFPRPAAL